MPKISELNAITSLLGTDLIAVAHDVDGLPSTRKISINDFSNVISSAVTTNYSFANTTFAGVIKVGENLSVNATGYINAPQSILPSANTNEGYVLTWDDALGQAVWQGFSGVVEYSDVSSSNTYVADRHENVLFVNPNNISQNITIILPDNTSEFPPEQGKTYLVKNIDPGNGYKTIVTTRSGVDSGSNYIENPVTGAMVVAVDLIDRGSGDTWVFNGNVWRHTASQRAIPIFYISKDTFAQVVFKNASASNSASSDLVGYNNIGDENAGTGPFVDMGINSSTYTDTTFGNVWGPNDAYLYNYGGNLIIGPQTDHSVKILAGNTNVGDVKLTVNTTAVYVNSTMTIVNTTPSASPEMVSVYTRHNLLFSSNGNILKVDTDGLTTLPGLLKAPQSTKANNSVGSAGMISWDSNNIYVCVATNSWKKVTLNDF